MDTQTSQSSLKRRRRKSSSDKSSSNQNTSKLTNKERAKIHRDSKLLYYVLGKRKYYQELEQKVEILEKELQLLRNKYNLAINNK